MDAFERAARIEQLQRENDAARERRAAREVDPAAELEAMIAEHAREPVARPYVEREGPATETPLRRAPQPEPGPSDWNSWFTESFANHIAPERAAMHEAVGEGLGAALFEVKTELVHRIEREVATLRNENTEMRSFVRAALLELERANTTAKNIVADLESERRERRALEVELAEQRGRLNAILRDGLG